MVETRDALGNRRRRVGRPTTTACCSRAWSATPTATATEVAFDTLGMVVGTAVMGKPLPAPAEGDTLAGFVADLTRGAARRILRRRRPARRGAAARRRHHAHRLRPRSLPAHAAGEPDDPTSGSPPAPRRSPARPTSATPLPPQGLKIQLSFSYSDGFGREIQKKIQAEPGRWSTAARRSVRAGSAAAGPSSTTRASRSASTSRSSADTHRFEFGVAVGVSPVLFYDPVERVVATLHPNHTYEKVVFDPWQQTTYDVNDTVRARNARPAIRAPTRTSAGYVAGYFASRSSLARPGRPGTHSASAARSARTSRHAAAARRRARRHADDRAFRRAGPPLPDARAQPRRLRRPRPRRHRGQLRHPRRARHRRQPARRARRRSEQAGDPLGRASSCATPTTCSATASTSSAWKPARAGCSTTWPASPSAPGTAAATTSRTDYDALRRPIEQSVRGTGADSSTRAR